MPPLISRALTLIFVLATSAVFSVAEVPAALLKDGDLLALFAGGSLTENIVNEIQFRGLAFHPSDDYLSNLGRIDEAQQLRKRSQALMMAMNQKRQ